MCFNKVTVTQLLYEHLRTHEVRKRFDLTHRHSIKSYAVDIYPNRDSNAISQVISTSFDFI